MYIIDSNQYAIEFLEYLLVLIAYFLKSKIHMLMAEML